MVAHEYAHAEAAYRQGDDTAYALGRLTMNPLKHIDPLMTVALPILLWVTSGHRWTFGAAKPVPVNPRNYRRYVRGDVIVSLAGIATNLALFVAFAGAFALIGFVGELLPSVVESLVILQRMAIYGMRFNLVLAFFNLIPIPPLDGSHVFSRFNPAAGVNFNPRAGLTLYTGYSEGMRAPTAIELTCADPAAPCSLPNDFVADPPLAAEISRTLELGARGRAASWQWSAAAYQSRLSSDIEFISSNPGAPNAGYYANIGATRRMGLELAAARRTGPLTLSARYGFIDATFRSAFSESSPFNSSANANGAILVTPGDRIPGIARQTLKLRLEYQLPGRWSAAANLIASSGVYARGDESNGDINGQLPGYLLVNLDVSCHLTGAFEVFARIDNLFDTRYYNFGILGENFFTGPDHTFGPATGIAPVATQFRGPGAPFGAWVGMRYAFGSASPGAAQD